MFPYDLHCHSDYSDGDYEVATVFEKAKQAGLKGIVVTDHNSVGHFDEASASAARFGIWTCQGIEVTSQYQDVDIHILGYSRKFNAPLGEAVAPIRAGYQQRARAIVEKLKSQANLSIDFDELLARRQGKLVTRYNIAEEIVKVHGLSLKEAQNLIGRSGPAWEPYGDWVPTPASVVELIHRAGGIAVFAHPGDIKRGGQVTDAHRSLIVELTEQLVAARLDGIEVRHSSHSEADTNIFTQLAARHGLMVTGGSDWHGEVHHPEITLGMAGISQREFEVFLKYLSK